MEGQQQSYDIKNNFMRHFQYFKDTFMLIRFQAKISFSQLNITK